MRLTPQARPTLTAARAADLGHDIVVLGERHQLGQVGTRLGGLGRLEGLQETEVIDHDARVGIARGS
jgi:hypothetical protein